MITLSIMNDNAVEVVHSYQQYCVLLCRNYMVVVCIILQYTQPYNFITMCSKNFPIN